MSARLYYCPDCDGVGLTARGCHHFPNDPACDCDVTCWTCDEAGHIEVSRAEGERRGLRPYTPSRRRWNVSVYRKGRPYSPEGDPLTELARARKAGIGYRSAAYANARRRAMGARA